MKPEPKAEPVQAWKDLVLAYSAEDGFYIQGPSYKQQKYALENVKAQCFSPHSHTHECPDISGSCLCGFNAWKNKNKTRIAKDSLDFKRSGFAPRPSRAGSIDVLAKVLLYGRVVEYQYGYRAEYQDIECIEVPDAALTAFASHHEISLMEMRNALQCDIQPIETSWILKGKKTELELRVDKNGKPYVYQGYLTRFNQALPQRQPQLRAATFHFNPDTLTISVFESWQVQQKRSKDDELVYPCSPRTYLYRYGVWLRKYNGKFICVHDRNIDKKADGTRLSTRVARTKQQNAVPTNQTRSKDLMSEVLELLETHHGEKIEEFRNQEAIRHVKKDCERRLILAGIIEPPTKRVGTLKPKIDNYSGKAVCVCGEHEGDKIISLNNS